MAGTSVIPPNFGGVLVASGDAARRDQIVSILNTNRWPVIAADGGADALNKLENSECDLLLLDRCLPDLDPDEFVLMVKRMYPGVEVVELGSSSGSKTLGQPNHLDPGLMRVLANTIPDGPVAKPETTSASSVGALPRMVGSSTVMQEVYRMVRLVARRDTSVLIMGPTGSGKELVAHAIHELSNRASKPFVAINCAAIPEALLESELFGYIRKPFTPDEVKEHVLPVLAG